MFHVPEVCLVVISQLDIRYFNYSQMTMAQEDEGNARDFQSAGEFQSQLKSQLCPASRGPSDSRTFLKPQLFLVQNRMSLPSNQPCSPCRTDAELTDSSTTISGPPYKGLQRSPPSPARGLVTSTPPSDLSLCHLLAGSLPSPYTRSSLHVKHTH